MTNNINVSLDGTNGINRLSVTDNGGQNQVAQNASPTTISWNLTGQLTQGDFSPMDAALPGFAWIQAPPAGLFGTPTISANGNSLSITDNHVNSSSNGTWIYMLRVNYNGTVLSTQATISPGGTVNNPVIVNH